MEIMVDANIIISAILFPKSIISEILKHIVLKNKIILSQYTIESKADIFITGDKDFDDIKIKKPIIMRPNNYKEKYMSQKEQNCV